MKAGDGNIPAFLNLAELKKIVNATLRYIPDYLKDDCFSAALVGILTACKAASNATSNQSAYFRQCVKSSVYKEVAALYPVFSLQPSILSLLYRYKKGETVALSEETLRKLASLHFQYYNENGE